jgi:hypothetical protein
MLIVVDYNKYFFWEGICSRDTSYEQIKNLYYIAVSSHSFQSTKVQLDANFLWRGQDYLHAAALR